MQGKRVLVFGLARSGVGAAKLLTDLGAEVTVTDRKEREQLLEYTALLPRSVTLTLGGHPKNLNGTDLIIVSPGVPLNIEPLAAAREKGITVIGELELAYQILRDTGRWDDASRQVHRPSFLAVTGTNGKSTTTTLLDLMLRKEGLKTVLGGNIGTALTEEIHKALRREETGEDEGMGSKLSPRALPFDYIVAEVSSFQLEAVDRFAPQGATILNISPDHLDRYHSLEEYAEAKARVFMNQDKNDFLVLNADDDTVMKVYQEKAGMRGSRFPKTYFFSRNKKVEGVYWSDGSLFCNLPDMSWKAGDRELMRAEEIGVKGVHNLENAMAASAMALLAGCSAEAVAEALRDFAGLEHRMEFVREIQGTRFINDSKGTNVGAVLKSLEGFTEPIILIAGGRDKAGDFTQLRPLIRERVKVLILIGEASMKMKDVLGDLTETIIASDLGAAVTAARDRARRGDVVLLSPACASFDMFRDFEDRGRQFKKLVMELA